MSTPRKHCTLSAVFGFALSALVAGSTTLTTTSASVAQELDELPLVAVFLGGAQDVLWPRVEALKDGLKELGYFEGQNIGYEYRFGEGNTDNNVPNAKELVALEPAVIVTGGRGRVRELLALTSSIPIVAVQTDANLMTEFVSNFERPEGNVTGNVFVSPGTADDYRLLKELVPGAARIGHLTSELSDEDRQSLRDTAAGLDVTIILGETATPEDALATFQSVVAEGVDALTVEGNRYDNALPQIIDAVTAARIPTIYQRAESVPDGALISLGVDAQNLWHVASYRVDQLLRGRPVADMPIVQINRFLLWTNLTSAEAIGLTIPPSVMSRVTQAFE